MVDWTTIAIVLPTLVVAYVIFGIAGFGTALVAAPVLAHAMPIARSEMEAYSGIHSMFQVHPRIKR